MSDPTPQPMKMPDVLQWNVILNTKNNQVLVRGPIHQRMLSIKILAQAIEIVIDQPAIIPHTANGTPKGAPQPPAG